MKPFAMKLAPMLTTALIGLGTCGVWGADDPATQSIKLKKDDHILFLGDSLTAMSIGRDGWVTRVRKALEAKHPDLNLHVSSVATGGHTTDNLLARLGSDVLPNKPTVVFIQIGVNDAGQGFTAEKFKGNLESLIAQLRASGARVVLCSLTSLGEKHDGTNKIDPKLEEFAQIARDVARETQVPLNDLRKAFVQYWKEHNPQNKEKDILTYDGNHFNEDGHKFVAEQMLGKLE